LPLAAFEATEAASYPISCQHKKKIHGDHPAFVIRCICSQWSRKDNNNSPGK
jgi:hypothetical protein